MGPMIRSNGRIRVTHQGTLPRSDELRTLVRARGSGQPYDADTPAQRLQRNRLGGTRHVYQCVGPLTYTGESLVQTDIANLRAAMDGLVLQIDDPDLADGWQVDPS